MKTILQRLTFLVIAVLAVFSLTYGRWYMENMIPYHTACRNLKMYAQNHAMTVYENEKMAAAENETYTVSIFEPKVFSGGMKIRIRDTPSNALIYDGYEYSMEQNKPDIEAGLLTPEGKGEAYLYLQITDGSTYCYDGKDSVVFNEFLRIERDHTWHKEDMDLFLYDQEYVRHMEELLYEYEDEIETKLRLLEESTGMKDE